jgi:hypothetical protein
MAYIVNPEILDLWTMLPHTSSLRFQLLKGHCGKWSESIIPNNQWNFNLLDGPFVESIHRRCWGSSIPSGLSTRWPRFQYSSPKAPTA